MNQTQLSAVALPMVRSRENKMTVSVNVSPILQSPPEKVPNEKAGS